MFHLSVHRSVSLKSHSVSLLKLSISKAVLVIFPAKQND